jgi:SAM-dependent methyltransferase
VDPAALIEEILAAHLPAEHAAAVAREVREHLAAVGDEAARGVSSPRRDFGTAWDEARAAAYAPMEHTGAVHLELGSFSTFGAEQVRALVDGDGLGELIRLDPDLQWECEVHADARALPLRSGVVDRVVSNSTIEHIPHPHAVLAEIHRVLRPGGLVNTAMPFVWEEHGYPEDHVRLTRGFFERVLPEIGFVDVVVDRDATAGLYYTVHNALKMGRVDASLPEATAARELQALAVGLLAALTPLDRLFEDGARSWFHSTRVLARKPGPYEPSRRTRDAGRPFVDRALDLLADPVSKQPLRRNGDRLACTTTGTSYAVLRSGAVNFMEPRMPAPPREPALARARRLARRATG